MRSSESMPHARSSERSPADRVVVEYYDQLRAFSERALERARISNNVAVDAEDVVQRAVQRFLDHKDDLVMSSDDENYTIVALAYLYTIIRNHIVSLRRDLYRTRTLPAGEVDISPEKVVGQSPVSDFSMGESKDAVDASDEDYVYHLTFGPLSYEGEMSAAELRAQRALHIFKLRLEGMRSKEIARDIFAPDSRYAAVSPTYDLDKPKDMKAAANLVDQTLQRFVPQILEEMHREVLGDDATVRVNERVIRSLWGTSK